MVRVLSYEAVPGRCISDGQTHIKFTDAKVNHSGNHAVIIACLYERRSHTKICLGEDDKNK